MPSAATIVAIAQDEDAALPGSHGTHAHQEDDLDAPFVYGLRSCVRSRCLGISCVIAPCLLFLLLSWIVKSAHTRFVLRVLAAVPIAIYIFCGVVLVCTVTCRQIIADTEQANTSHEYLQKRAKLKQIAVTSGDTGTQVSTHGRWALFLQAAKTNDLEMAQWCISHDQVIDQVDHLGRTALHWCALSGSDEILELLLHNGASIDLQDTLEGLTALHYSAYYGHVKCTRVLVAAGATTTVKDNRRMNPLQLAEMASLQLASVQPSHPMFIKFLRLAMQDEATPPLQQITGLTAANLVERQMMAQPQAK